MRKELRQGLLFTAVTMMLFGGAYHGLVWGIGQTFFAAQAEGSLVRRVDGTVIGSRLIAQAFTRPEYFRPRPSAVDYNAASTGGSNYGPANPAHLDLVRSRIDAIIRDDGVAPAAIPSEMVTASGAGLDPDIPPAGADMQVRRVAAARGVPAERVRDLVRAHTSGPAFGLLGPNRINVLELNLALDETFGPVASGTSH